ncbi:MAG: response regulator [Candidatus Methylomirabilis sp.]
MRDIGGPVEVLLVEDSPGDVRLTQEALTANGIPNHLHVVEDGVQALAFLRKQGKHGNAPRPNLILLDLNLPKKDGREVLAEIKGDGNLRRIPVVVLTTSGAERDVLKAYDLGVNCYVAEPVDLDSIMKAVKSIARFWMTVVVLPLQ